MEVVIHATTTGAFLICWWRAIGVGVARKSESFGGDRGARTLKDAQAHVQV
jgi:hypothetical protein